MQKMKPEVSNKKTRQEGGLFLLQKSKS